MRIRHPVHRRNRVSIFAFALRVHLDQAKVCLRKNIQHLRFAAFNMFWSIQKGMFHGIGIAFGIRGVRRSL
jgi:CO/xanthine dehydrogenase Mo-binding subunit